MAETPKSETPKADKPKVDPAQQQRQASSPKPKTFGGRGIEKTK